MQPVMSFVAVMADNIFILSPDIPTATVATIAAEATKFLPRCPISTKTLKHSYVIDNQNRDCLAVQIEEYLVSYSIRNERIRIHAVEKFPC